MIANLPLSLEHAGRCDSFFEMTLWRRIIRCAKRSDFAVFVLATQSRLFLKNILFLPQTALCGIGKDPTESQIMLNGGR